MISVRQHKVAQAAFECVNKRVKNNIDQKKYAALANKLPNLIMQNGLAQATGFLLAKNESTNEHFYLLNDLAFIVAYAEASNSSSLVTATEGDGLALHKKVIDSEMTQLMLLTQQTLNASGAIRRYVQGLMDTKAKPEGDSNV